MAGELKKGQLGANSVDGTKVENDSLTKADIAEKLVEDLGTPGRGYVFITGGIGAQVDDADTITVGVKVFEFDDGGGIVPGNIVVPMGGAGPWDADDAIANLVTAINGEATCVAEATAWTANAAASAGCSLIEKAVTGSNFALAKSFAEATVSAANSVGAAVAADKKVFYGSHTISAVDVTALALLAGTGEVPIGSIGSVTSPAFQIICAYDANGVKLPDNTLRFVWRQHDANLWDLTLLDVGAVLANTNVIHWMAMA